MVRDNGDGSQSIDLLEVQGNAVSSSHVVQTIGTEWVLNPGATGDFDGNGKIDLVVAGNNYDVTPMLGRYDGSYGLLLKGDGQGNFTAIDARESGITIDGQVRDMKMLRTAMGQLIAVARNDDQLRMIRPGTPNAQPAKRVSKSPSATKTK